MKKRSVIDRNVSGNVVSEKIFADLYNQHYDYVYLFLYRKTSNRQVTEELTYEAFLKLWHKLNKDEKVENIQSYLLGIAKNLIYDYFLKQSKYSAKHVLYDEIPETISNNPTPEQLTLNNELRNELNSAIENLSPQASQIFRMVRINGLKYKEVANELGISVNSVDTQLARAVKKLRKVLSVYKQNKTSIKRQIAEKSAFISILFVFF